MFPGHWCVQLMFRLFISQLRGVEQPHSPMFARHFHLLEQLTSVRAFTVIVSLKPEGLDMALDLFNVIFDVETYPVHLSWIFRGSLGKGIDFGSCGVTSKVESLLLEVLAMMTEEFEDIPNTILDAIATQLCSGREVLSLALTSVALDQMLCTLDSVPLCRKRQ